MFVVYVIMLGSEDNHDTVLQEIVELNGIGIQALTFEVINSE